MLGASQRSISSRIDRTMATWRRKLVGGMAGAPKHGSVPVNDRRCSPHAWSVGLTHR
jgi:hypothetical protein